MPQNDKTTTITYCPSCKALYQVPESAIGKEVACKKCGRHFTVTLLKKEPPALPAICQVILNYNMAGKDLLMLAVEEYQAQQVNLSGQSLEAFLVQRGVVSPADMILAHDIEAVWKKRQLEKQFAAIAVKAGFLSQEAANDALKEQAILFKESRKTIILGDILVKKSQMTPQQRDAILKKQNRIDEISPLKAKENPPTPLAEKARKAPSPDQTSVTASGPSPSLEKPVHETEQPSPHANKSPDGNPHEPKPLIDIHTLIEEKRGHAIEGDGFEIIVTRDRSAAYLRGTEEINPSLITLPVIQKLLDDNKITYGVLNSEMIKKALESAGSGKPAFMIAEGTPSQGGKEAQIIIHFDTTPRKAGRVGEDGQIDFRDRGEIPHVKIGELLAEKIPVVQPIPGIDVYGDPIPVDTIEDAPMLFGSGVTPSEDGLKLFAKVTGQPQLSVGGRISVLDELTINGDVGYKTGHIEFEGNILITGTIHNGFKVKGGNVRVMEVNGGELELTGSLVVANGVTDAKITALGDITAKFISKSDISTFGDILVSKIIVDSDITCGGSCKAPGGKILSSTISAKYGIEAVDIGTASSSPCKLKAGHDDHLAKEINGINAAIDRTRATIKECQDLNKKFHKEEEETHMSIAEQAHIQDRSQIEIRQTKSQIADLKKQGDPKEISRLEARIRELEKNAKQAENDINALFERQEKIIESIEINKKRITAFEPKLRELTAEKNNILQYAKKEKGIAIVKATGTIYAGTIITGVHSTKVLNESYRRAQIKEVRVTDPDSPMEYEMRLIK